ncbi:MAG: hypothetical protein P9L94_12140 [Candidatus Hinthialibacter antarcticus]|nr:hypothetical protein [Candidatus Hinthialibacter antarcticus]
MNSDSQNSKNNDSISPLWFFGLSLLSAGIAISYYWRYTVISNDDAFIYFAMVRNIVAGHGPVLNPGDTHSPATSLVWVYGLAFFHWLAPSAKLTFLSMSISSTLLFFASIFWCYVFQKPAKEAALAAPFAIVSILLFRLCPGMDISLSLFVYSLIFFAYFRGWPEVAAALCGFSFFCRGESLVLIAPLIAHYLYQAYADGRLKESVRRLATSSLSFIGVLCLGLLLQKICLDTPYPSTLKVKILQGMGGWITYWQYLPTYIFEGIGSVKRNGVYALVGLFVLGWPGAVLFAAAALHAIAFSILSIAAYNWYSWILQASLRFYVFLGATKLIEWLVRFCAWLINLISPVQIPAAAARLLGVAIGIWICFGHFFWLIEYPLRADDPYVLEHSLTGVYYEFADYLNAQPVGEPGGKRPVVLSEEIGVLLYQLNGYEVRDVNGLASPGLTRANLVNWKFWINKYEPEFLVKFGGNERPVLYYESDSDYKPAIYTYKLVLHDPKRPVGLYKRDHSYERVVEYDNLRLLMDSRAANTLEPLIDSRYPGGPTLYITPQAEFVVPAPTVASQFSMEVGLRSVSGKEVMNSDGVTFHIIGKHKNGQHVVYSQTPVAPVATETNSLGSSVIIQFQFEKGAVEEFRIIVDPNPRGPAYDWPFITNFIFQ